MTLQKSTDINKVLVTDQQRTVWDQSSASCKYHAVYMYLLLLSFAEKRFYWLHTERWEAPKSKVDCWTYS